MSDDKYENIERRIDTIAGRNAYWEQLRKANAEYESLPSEQRGIDANGPADYASGFYTWMQFKYGIEML